ncbi:MAG: Kelch repeat-containing protein [Chloroflexota bacterium]
MAVLVIAAGPAAASGGGSWASGSPLPTARYLLASVTKGTMTYSLGGCSIGGCASADTILDTNEAYNASTDTWTTKAPMPTARAATGAALGRNGLIYVEGGTVAPCCTPLSTNEAYNPTRNSWTERAPMPTARYGAAVVDGFDGRVYVFGGYTNSVGETTVEAYSPGTNTWTCSVGDTSSGCASTSLAPIPELSYGGAAVRSGKMIYLLIGNNGSAKVGDIYAYDTSTNTWTQKATMPAARDYVGMAIGKTHLIYAIGGAVSQQVQSSANEAYNPAKNSWTEETPLPNAVVGPGAALTSTGATQVAGGGTDSNDDGTNFNQLFTP